MKFDKNIHKGIIKVFSSYEKKSAEEYFHKDSNGFLSGNSLICSLVSSDAVYLGVCSQVSVPLQHVVNFVLYHIV